MKNIKISILGMVKVLINKGLVHGTTPDKARLEIQSCGCCIGPLSGYGELFPSGLAGGHHPGFWFI